jgi:CHASE2 domain-containing sensor protein
MEVVLLWLDDLDDVLFSAALFWEHLRRAVLKVGLGAALALAASELSATATQWAPAFSSVAAVSVLAWLGGAALRAFYYRPHDRSPAPAGKIAVSP